MIGLLEMRRRKLQFALISAIFALIAYLVFMINGLGLGLQELAGSAVLRLDADAIAYSDAAGLSVLRSELGQQAVDQARQRPGVNDVAAVAYTAVTYRLDDGEVDSAALLGYDPGSLAEPEVTSGRGLTPEDRRAVLADRRFLAASDLKVGDSVSLAQRLSTVEYEIVGEIDTGSFFFQPTLFALRESVLDLKYGAGERPAASILLLKGDDLIGTSDGLAVVSKQTAFDNIEGVAGQSSTVTSLRIFGYVVGAVVLGAFFYVLTLQKVNQIGVLKAVGAGTSFVLAQLLVQVVAVAVLGLLIAVPLALLTDRLLDAGGGVVPIAISSGEVLFAAGALVVTAVIGSLFSCRQVLRVDPIIALGQQP